MAQSCSMLEDHLMPMMQIEDRAQPGEIVCQVFNFIDVMGGLNTLDADGKSNEYNFISIVDSYLKLI